MPYSQHSNNKNDSKVNNHKKEQDNKHHNNQQDSNHNQHNSNDHKNTQSEMTEKNTQSPASNPVNINKTKHQSHLTNNQYAADKKQYAADKPQNQQVDLSTSTLSDSASDNTSDITSTDMTPPDMLVMPSSYMAEQQTFFYGEAEYSEEDTYATMTIYDPDADRFEDIEDNIIEDEIINCYAYARKTGKQVKQVEIDAVSQVLSNDKHFVWLGLYEPSIDTLTQVQQAFDLHELALEDAVADHQRAKVESYDNDTIFVVVQTAKLENNIIQYGKTAIFMGKNFIITIRTGPSNSYKPVRQHYKQRPEKLKLGPIFVLHAILDFIVDNYLPIVDRLGSYLREQEQSIFSYEFSRSTLRRLYELKSQLIRMRAVMLPVQDICNFFINHKKNELISFFPSSAKPYFRDVNDHLLQALDAVNGLNEMLSVAMDTYMAVVNMGQNDVVRKLAAWAGILAVPTAIAGIYGMNFDIMPELHFKYGYLMVWGLIIVICSSLYRIFKKTGWL